MSLVRNKFTALFCLMGASAYLAACNDAGSAPDARIMQMFDAAVPDGPPMGPDAAPVGGTIAALDVKITNDLTGTGLPGLAGGAISASFEAPASDTGTITFPPNMMPTQPGCEVHIYDVAAGKHPGVPQDDGMLTITGDSTPAVGVCVFSTMAKAYVCPAGAPGMLTVGTTITNNMNGTATITFGAGATLPTDNVGRAIQLAGFSNAANNSSAASPLFFIMANPAPSTIVVLNPAAVNEVVATAVAGYTIFTGTGPTPAQRPFLAAAAKVHIVKAAMATPAVDIELTAAGAGLKLADDSALPEAMPLTAAVNFKVSCNVAQNGVCGSAGAGPTGSLEGLIVTGRTTDGVVPAGVPPFFMPAATGKVASFTCTFIGSQGTIPKEAWAAVLAASPTRIETRILRVEALKGRPNIIAGHGLIGYTTVPPP